jgi:hypothetical protein
VVEAMVEAVRVAAVREEGLEAGATEAEKVAVVRVGARAAEARVEETVEAEMNTHMKQLSRSRSTRTTTASSDSSTSASASASKQKRVRTAFQATPVQTVCRRDVEIKVGFD